jgi:hypothetical protein
MEDKAEANSLTAQPKSSISSRYSGQRQPAGHIWCGAGHRVWSVVDCIRATKRGTLTEAVSDESNGGSGGMNAETHGPVSASGRMMLSTDLPADFGS